jgi:hypothetical protein
MSLNLSLACSCAASALGQTWHKQARQIDAREALSGLPEQMRHGVGPANSPFTIKAERPRKQQATSNKQQATSNYARLPVFVN